MKPSDYRDSGLPRIKEYIEQGIRSIKSIGASFGADRATFSWAVYKVIATLRNLKKSDHIFIIGNGGSASIASEAANRFWKSLDKKVCTAI